MTGTCLQHCWGHGSFKSPVGTAWERGWVGLGPGDTPSTLLTKRPHVHFQEGQGFIDKEAEAPRGHVTGSSSHTLAGGRTGNQSQLSYTQPCFCKKKIPHPIPSFLSPIGKQVFSKPAGGKSCWKATWPIHEFLPALLQGFFPPQGLNKNLLSPGLAGGFFTMSSIWEALATFCFSVIVIF